MCSYYKVFNNTIEECPHIISKWKAKVTGNKKKTPNANQNVQKISVDPWDKLPTIFVLTRGGTVTGDDNGEPWKNMRIQSATQNKVSFDV